MEAHRFFVTWLFVVGLVGVYAQNYDEDISEKLANWIVARSKYPQLDESASAMNPANEDYSSEGDAISEFVNEVRRHKRSNPSSSRMSEEDFNWHIKEGEEALKSLSQKTRQQKENREWVKRRMQAQQRDAQIAANVKAANDKKKDQKIVLEERVPQWKQNRPGPSRRT